ncbi:hypothetical protein [Streptomyces sp. NPDC051183]|uniref:CIS tube protein n=1 Tax=unclassified Streptomyces TaxID=2593676 RepID=UPI0034187056
MSNAVFHAFKPPIGNEEKPSSKPVEMKLQYNPADLGLVKETRWARHSTRLAPHTSTPEFLGSQPQVLTMSLLFSEPDSTSDGSNADSRASVAERIAMLRTWCEPHPEALKANESSPPWIKLLWGEAPTFEWMVLQRLSIRITRFSEQGKLLRAVCELTLEEVGVDK